MVIYGLFLKLSETCIGPLRDETLQVLRENMAYFSRFINRWKKIKEARSFCEKQFGIYIIEKEFQHMQICLPVAVSVEVCTTDSGPV